MLLNYKLKFQLLRNMGFRYVLFRIWYEIQKQSRLLKIKHPTNCKVKFGISLEDWKKVEIPFVISEREKLKIPKSPNAVLEDNANKILSGEIRFFSFDWKNLGLSYDWITNPETSFRYDINKHWSEINDFNPRDGDIKYVWEKSRFTHLLTVMRYDYHFNQDHSEFVLKEIDSWIDSNPINQGPNWKCSQEISLRVINWIYILNFYKNSSALNTDMWAKIQNVIYWSLHHVYTNINFSRIAVRNNHAITETLVLSISNMLFPFFNESVKWARNGRKWFEQEVAYQIYPDGTFLQFSMNYHRVVVQLLSLGIAVSELHRKPFSETVYKRAYGSLNFLYQCLQHPNGYLPNYGANDGALFFPFTDNEYRDYRPQLNTLHRVLTGQDLFEENGSKQDVFWFQINENKNCRFVKLTQTEGMQFFKDGGYFLCRTKSHFTFLRCGNHKDRPSHADNLHLDIWVDGINILRDSGSYKYNSLEECAKYFPSTQFHNTVVVDSQSQMLKGDRFIWYYWSQALETNLQETEDNYIFTGRIAAYRFLNKRASHKRVIHISKSSNKWNVKDSVSGLDEFQMKQIWHKGVNNNLLIRPKSNVLKENNREYSYESLFYGNKIEGNAVSFTFNNSIETEINYVT